ncbi:Nitrogen permease regulator 2 [Mortierella alpina]|uniref:Nitrogen permease regulator 2 n=1 Tax=Mortierella alpina TaxID=64518 RepID=A0A9P6J1E4_MORAP|nr:Nitrogen permease regulator 2 [Mortierella alpina]
MGFPRLLSIFYCTFHPIQGPKVLYEVPEGSILSKTSPLVDFDSISEYLIPKVELCSKLVTISTPTCKIIGFPINLEHKKFQRNALMFNLAFVFDKDAEISSYEPVVRKMARVLKALEKESEFLSQQTRVAMMEGGAQPPSTSASTTPALPAGTATASSTGPPSTTASPALSNSSSTAAAENNQTSSSSAATLETIVEAARSVSLQDAPINGALPPSSSSAHNAPAAPTGGSATQAPTPAAPSDPIAVSALLSANSPDNVTSTAIVSSPPSMGSTTIATVLTAPPSCSPFPSRSASSSSTATRSGIAASSTAASQSTAAASSPSSLLQQAQDGSGMQNLIEQLIEDLNSYCECQIPIDSANTINLKLFPTYPNPAPVYDYQVPISTVNLEALTDVNWDMTMQRITGYINGVNSVKRIAEFADVETGLARMCMEHLLYYGCIIMVDLFQFKNIYAVKMEMMRLTEDVALQYECVAYVTLPDMHAPSFAKVFSLYCSLQYGVVLQDWIEQNQISDYNIDVRRFISFGVIKGFLYRVHKYPILDYHDPNLVNTGTTAAPGTPSKSNAQLPITSGASTSAAPGLVTAAMAPSVATTATSVVSSRPETPSNAPSTQRKVYGQSLAPTDQHLHTSPHPPAYHSQPHQHQGDHPTSAPVIPPALKKLLNGEHHYDELCTQFGCSVRELDQILATDSRVKFIYR